MSGERIEVEPTGHITSPSFVAHSPETINPERLDPAARQAMERVWGQGSFQERQLDVFHLQNVYVSAESLILNSELQVIANASDPYTDQEIADAVADIRDQERRRVLHHFDLAVLSKRRAVGNYGHFLMEMLPMGLLGRSLVSGFDARYVVHRVPPELQDVVFRAFRLVGIPLNKLLVRDDREPAYFRHLIVVRGLTTHGSYMSPLCVRTVAAMADHVAPGTNRRLFVTRTAGWNRGRMLLNQEDVAKRLSARGFVVIDPGSMSLEEQIAAFKGAEVVVGASGAAMTNIAFCQPDARVVVLAPARFPDTFFWFIATHNALRYAELRCEQLPMDGPEGWKADFLLQEEDIARLERLK